MTAVITPDALKKKASCITSNDVPFLQHSDLGVRVSGETQSGSDARRTSAEDCDTRSSKQFTGGFYVGARERSFIRDLRHARICALQPFRYRKNVFKARNQSLSPIFLPSSLVRGK